MNRLRLGFLACMILVLPHTSSGQGIVVDHTSISLFDQIPETYLQAARNLRVLFLDRSVGVNTNDALNCFTATEYGLSPPSCRQDYQLVNGNWQLVLRKSADKTAGLVNTYINFNPVPRATTAANGVFIFLQIVGKNWPTDLLRAFITGPFQLGFILHTSRYQ